MADKTTTLLTAILIVVVIGLVLLYFEGTPKSSQMPIYNTSTVAAEPVIYVDTPPVYWNYVPAWTGYYAPMWWGGGGSGLPGWHHAGKIPGGGFGGGHHGGHGGGSPPLPAPAPAHPAPPSA